MKTDPLMVLMCCICHTFLVHNLRIYKVGMVRDTTDVSKYKIFGHRVRKNVTTEGAGKAQT